MYSNKFVANVLVDGRVVKEFANGTANIPFGSEYSLKFRNKHNRRAAVKFFIDGENVSSNGYVINPHETVTIHRHAEVDKAFKFVALDSEEAQDFGKNGPNLDKKKGLIEARFYLEKKPTLPVYPILVQPKPFWPAPYWYDTYGNYCSSMRSNTAGPTSLGGTISSDGTYDEGNLTGTYDDNLSITCNTQGMDNQRGRRRSRGICRSINQEPTLDDGCTVEGSITGQAFHKVNVDLETTYTTLKIFCNGYDPDTNKGFAQLGAQVVKSSNKLSVLEKKNQNLREQIAKLENEKLEQQLEDLKN